MVGRLLGDDRERVATAKLVLHLIGHDGAAKPGPQNDDMRHVTILHICRAR